MRTVPRRWTKFKRWVPPAPWTFRSEYPDGAPRVCRSNHAWEIRSEGVSLGWFDPYLHLYSSGGPNEMRSLVKIDSEWHVLYRFKEWTLATERAFWLEFVSESREAVARISRTDAQRFGIKTEHSGQPVWAVPFSKYEVHRR